MLLRAVELVVLCGAAADGASKLLAFRQLAYYKDTSKHCTEPRAALHAR